MSAVSSKFSSALLYALKEERHFALEDGFALANLSSLRIVRVKNSVRLSHLFDHLGTSLSEYCFLAKFRL